MNAHHSSVVAIKRINKKFVNKIEALRKKGLRLDNGLENEELNTLERALSSLTTQMQADIRAKIETLKKDFTRKKQMRFETFNESSKLNNANYKDIAEFVEELKMNNDSKEISIIEQSMLAKVRPGVDKIIEQIQELKPDGLKHLTTTFKTQAEDLQMTFSFIHKMRSEIRDALEKGFNKILTSLKDCAYRLENYDPKSSGPLQKDKYQRLIEEA